MSRLKQQIKVWFYISLIKINPGKWLYPSEVETKMVNFFHKITGEEVYEGKLEKMSKSKNNVIDLDLMLETHGADAIRMFVLSDSPAERDLEWSNAGIDGCKNLLLNSLPKQTEYLIY